MYNRYIPQPDGTYRRSRMPDSPPPQPAPRPQQEFRPPEEKPEPYCPPEPEPRFSEPQQDSRPKEQPQRRMSCSRSRQRAPYPTPYTPPRQNHQSRKQESCPESKDTSVGSFLRQLLPKDFDTSDLLIVLLLLLMSGDCKEDQNSSLLTLALYLFM